MLLLCFSLFASQDAIQFGTTVEDTFDLTRCTSYFLKQPLFPINEPPINTEHVVTLYIPHECWSDDRFDWNIEASKNAPDNPSLECFVITNGYDGKQLFFSALRSGELEHWEKIEQSRLPLASFYGYKHTASETFALMGRYTELSPNALIGEKFTACSAGTPYIKQKDRLAGSVAKFSLYLEIKYH